MGLEYGQKTGKLGASIVETVNIPHESTDRCLQTSSGIRAAQVGLRSGFGSSLQ